MVISGIPLALFCEGGHDEALFQDALDSLVDKVDGANKEWEDTTLQIQADHKRKIISFGHTPLEF